MAQTTPTEAALADPLSETARKERRALLGFSMAAILIAKTGLLPTEITNFGIKFNPDDHATLLKGLAVVVLYFLVAFIVYASTDFLRWRLAFFRSWQEIEEIVAQPSTISSYKMEEFLTRKSNSLRRASVPAMWLRAIFEFGLPVAVGIYATVVLAKSW